MKERTAAIAWGFKYGGIIISMSAQRQQLPEISLRRGLSSLVWMRVMTD